MTPEMVLHAEKLRNKEVTLIFIAGCYISKASQVLVECLEMRDCLVRYTQLAMLSCSGGALRSEQMSKPLPLGIGERSLSITLGRCKVHQGGVGL